MVDVPWEDFGVMNPVLSAFQHLSQEPRYKFPKLPKMKKWHFRGCNISCEFGNIKRNKDHNLNFNIVPKFPKYIC